MHSTAYDFEQFAMTDLWKDIQDELSLWLKQVHEAMEDTTISNDTLRQLQGNAQALRNVLKLPENVAENLRLQMEEEQDAE